MFEFRLSVSPDCEIPPFLPIVHLGHMMQFISNETQLGGGGIFLIPEKRKTCSLYFKTPLPFILAFLVILPSHKCFPFLTNEKCLERK